MGLINNLINKVKRAINRALNRKVDNAIDTSVNNAVNRNAQTGYNSNRQNSYNAPVRPAAKRNIVNELRLMLNPYAAMGYEIKENVSVGIFDPALEGQGIRNYNFAVFSNGNLIMCVMVTDHNRDRNRAFLVAKRVCVNSGVPFVNFYTHFPNDPEYMAERLRSYLA